MQNIIKEDKAKVNNFKLDELKDVDPAKIILKNGFLP